MINRPIANILIIDDDKGVVHTLHRLVETLGHRLEHAYTLSDGLEKLYSTTYDILLLDVNLPDGSGLDIISDVMTLPLHPQIIIMTAFSDPDGAELAIELGAWDYLEKPIFSKRLKLQISRALQFQEQKRKSDVPVLMKPNSIIGKSKPLQRCLRQASQIANSDANVLITGETGTGKELFAKMIHDNSSRQDHVFIIVDCSLLSENLIESVLFGHEKGSFTGADRKRDGLITLANNGTLFLDEIGELPESVQSSFLRVLQEKKYRAVGGEQEITSNFRIIAATNRDLGRMVHEKKFRNDLLFRLKTCHIDLPALKNIKQDIWEIAHFYKDQFCKQYEMEPKELSSDFLEMLSEFDWPGNVRELVHTIESCILTAKNEKILFAYHLPQKLRAKVIRASIKQPRRRKTDKLKSKNSLLKFNDVIENTEKEYLMTLYTETNGDLKKLIKISGISRAVLYRKLKKYNIK